MAITYKDATDKITILRCIQLYKLGIDVIFDEGRHVTFEPREKEVMLEGIKENASVSDS